MNRSRPALRRDAPLQDLAASAGETPSRHSPLEKVFSTCPDRSDRCSWRLYIVVRYNQKPRRVRLERQGPRCHGTSGLRRSRASRAEVTFQQASCHTWARHVDTGRWLSSVGHMDVMQRPGLAGRRATGSGLPKVNNPYRATCATGLSMYVYAWLLISHIDR